MSGRERKREREREREREIGRRRKRKNINVMNNFVVIYTYSNPVSQVSARTIL